MLIDKKGYNICYEALHYNLSEKYSNQIKNFKNSTISTYNLNGYQADFNFNEKETIVKTWNKDKLEEIKQNLKKILKKKIGCFI